MIPNIARTIADISEKVIGPNPSSYLVTGLVTSEKEEPLKIKLNPAVELDDDFFILSPFCREPDPEFFGGDFTGKLWRGLEKDDRVLMLKLPGTRSYYVLERIEKIIESK